jgi:predicted ATPase
VNFAWSNGRLNPFVSGLVQIVFFCACIEITHRHNVGNVIQARRFITLVDELYNHHCRLICTADGPPDDLFLGTMDGSIFDLERLVILEPLSN